MSSALAKGFGLAVREARQQAGVSQEGLAEAAGLDRAYVSGLERGRRNPTLDTMQRIASSLGVPLEGLVKRAGELS